jgi:hypothetical protein
MPSATPKLEVWVVRRATESEGDALLGIYGNEGDALAKITSDIAETAWEDPKPEPRKDGRTWCAELGVYFWTAVATEVQGHVDGGTSEPFCSVHGPLKHRNCRECNPVPTSSAEATRSEVACQWCGGHPGVDDPERTTVDAETRAREYHVWKHRVRKMTQHLLALVGRDVVKRCHGFDDETRAAIDRIAEQTQDGSPYKDPKAGWSAPEVAESPRKRVERILAIADEAEPQLCSGCHHPVHHASCWKPSQTDPTKVCPCQMRDDSAPPPGFVAADEPGYCALDVNAFLNLRSVLSWTEAPPRKMSYRRAWEWVDNLPNVYGYDPAARTPRLSPPQFAVGAPSTLLPATLIAIGATELDDDAVVATFSVTQQVARDLAVFLYQPCTIAKSSAAPTAINGLDLLQRCLACWDGGEDDPGLCDDIREHLHGRSEHPTLAEQLELEASGDAPTRAPAPRASGWERLREVENAVIDIGRVLMRDMNKAPRKLAEETFDLTPALRHFLQHVNDRRPALATDDVQVATRNPEPDGATS